MLPLSDFESEQLSSFYSGVPRNPQKGDHLTDLQAMKLAIIEATKAVGFVSPNPLVGCVILSRDGKLLGRGYHTKLGLPHAEVEALKGLSASDLQGATIFVTLEPCAHEGRTPSCAKAIAQLPVAQVVYGLQDPNPLVAGQGAQILEAAGIKVKVANEYFENSAELNQELENLCEHFLKNIREQKPFVSLKAASSWDGYLGLKSGESQWITSEASRGFGRILRASHDAVLVGKNTVMQDNPRLDFRHPRFEHVQKKVVVLDSKATILKSRMAYQLFETHSAQNLIWIVEEGFAFSDSRAQVVSVQRTTHLNDVLTKLWEVGVKSLYVEGGSQVVSSFINEKKFDRLYLFQGPMMLGGQSGQSWAAGVKVDTLANAIRLKNQRVVRIGEDLLMTAKRAE